MHINIIYDEREEIYGRSKYGIGNSLSIQCVSGDGTNLLISLTEMLSFLIEKAYPTSKDIKSIEQLTGYEMVRDGIYPLLELHGALVAEVENYKKNLEKVNLVRGKI